jgi:glutaredoxin-like protein NrdH
MEDSLVTLYALSTCVHCRHVREFLEQNSIAFDCTYVDKLEGPARTETMDKVRELNPRMSFPTMVVGPRHVVVVGYHPDAIKEGLE